MGFLECVAIVVKTKLIFVMYKIIFYFSRENWSLPLKPEQATDGWVTA